MSAVTRVGILTGGGDALESPRIITRPLTNVVAKITNVPLDSDLVTTARVLGITFGN